MMARSGSLAELLVIQGKVANGLFIITVISKHAVNTQWSRLRNAAKQTAVLYYGL